MDNLALIGPLAAVLFTCTAGAVGYGVLRQQVSSLRKDLDKLEAASTSTDTQIFKMLDSINRNLHRLLGKLDVDPVE